MKPLDLYNGTVRRYSDNNKKIILKNISNIVFKMTVISFILSFIVSCDEVLDVYPPEIEIIKPVDGATIKEGETISIEIDASDNKTITEVEISVDGNIIGNTSSSPYSVEWTVPSSLASEKYSIEKRTILAKAFDDAGNWGQDEISVNVKTPARVMDDFNNGNAYGWIEDYLAAYIIENGEYSIESIDDGFQHWAKHTFVPEGDFSFEASIKYISGNRNSPYGIGVFNTSETRTCLWIVKDGWYKISYYDNSWHDIRDWTSSSLIDTTFSNPNKLMIVKNGNSLEIYINDSATGSFSISSIGEVNRIGLYVQDDLHIHFDDIQAEGL
ncbi:MAG: Ig-like domain-containing protein [Bacteroidetes bacterium]|nr:Ig-like domain-containing protein [Bacteroidota bacterium]